MSAIQSTMHASGGLSTAIAASLESYVLQQTLYACSKVATYVVTCFCSGILPVLKPIFEQADGEVLLALITHLSVFYNLMPR